MFIYETGDSSLEHVSVSLERLRRAVGLHPTERLPYVCRGCERWFELEHHVCPTCGGFSVERSVID